MSRSGRSRRSIRAYVLAMLVAVVARSAAQSAPAAPQLEAALRKAASLPRLHALIIAQRGVIRAERRYRGPSLDTPVNIKSISKSIVSALVGIAIDEGKLRGVDQPIAPYFARYLMRQTDPRVAQITIGNLLSMQSGLTRTSGPTHAAWTASRDWVGYIFAAPLISDPGETMVYSTGNSHLLSAILTQATGRSTYAYARERLAKPLGVALPPWPRDPQGIYFGGNQMRLSAHALVRFGELYRNHGRAGGRQIVPERWIDESWTPRTRSIFSGQLYGYGWFIAQLSGHPLYFAWGYGGQFVFVMPDLELVVVTTSEPTGPRDMAHLGAIYDLLATDIVPAAEAVLRAPS